MMKFTFAMALVATAALAVENFPEPDEEDLAPFPPVWRQKYAYCVMKANPAYPTTNPYGFMRLQQFSGGPLMISGWMRNMPPPDGMDGYHGFSFNWSRFDGNDCKSTEGHFNPTWEEHGEQDSSPSHVGDLWPIVDFGGNAYYYSMAFRPTLFGGMNNISNRSMVVYEKPDDFGHNSNWESQYNGSVGREIACCNVRPFRIRRYPYMEVDVREVEVYEEKDTGSDDTINPDIKPENSTDTKFNGGGRRLQELLLDQYDEVDNNELRRLQDEDGVDVFTPEEYRMMFGEDFDPSTAVPFESATSRNLEGDAPGFDGNQ